MYNIAMDIKTLLHLQVAVGNTSDGWTILGDVSQLAKDTLDSYQAGQTKLMECKNCHILLNSDFFDRGCPLCGNKGEFLHHD